MYGLSFKYWERKQEAYSFSHPDFSSLTLRTFFQVQWRGEAPNELIQHEETKLGVEDQY